MSPVDIVKSPVVDPMFVNEPVPTINLPPSVIKTLPMPVALFELPLSIIIPEFPV